MHNSKDGSVASAVFLNPTRINSSQSNNGTETFIFSARNTTSSKPTLPTTKSLDSRPIPTSCSMEKEKEISTFLRSRMMATQLKNAFHQFYLIERLSLRLESSQRYGLCLEWRHRYQPHRKGIWEPLRQRNRIQVQLPHVAFDKEKRTCSTDSTMEISESSSTNTRYIVS